MLSKIHTGMIVKHIRAHTPENQMIVAFFFIGKMCVGTGFFGCLRSLDFRTGRGCGVDIVLMESEVQR